MTDPKIDELAKAMFKIVRSGHACPWDQAHIYRDPYPFRRIMRRYVREFLTVLENHNDAIAKGAIRKE